RLLGKEVVAALHQGGIQGVRRDAVQGFESGAVQLRQGRCGGQHRLVQGILQAARQVLQRAGNKRHFGQQQGTVTPVVLQREIIAAFVPFRYSLRQRVIFYPGKVIRVIKGRGRNAEG